MLNTNSKTVMPNNILRNTAKCKNGIQFGKHLIQQNSSNRCIIYFVNISKKEK